MPGKDGFYMTNVPTRAPLGARTSVEADRATVVHLDAPLGGVVLAAAMEIVGWISTPARGPIERLALVNGHGACISLSVVDRSDVREVYPNWNTAGFHGVIDIRDAVRGPWKLRYSQDGRTFEAPCALTADVAEAERFSAVKIEKLARIRSLLRCPQCFMTLDDKQGTLYCGNGHVFHAGPDAFDFLDAETRKAIGAGATDNVSAHGYDGALNELIFRTEGTILDVGAGLRPSYRPDVINVEIVPYPTTDVVCASEHLPFADGSIDLIISVAVLEHVRDPFAAASELVRVLRPGGRIFAAVPFLQPYHAYPNHYYNMTSQGLSNLFSGLEIERLDVPLSGGPIYALTWILQIWRRSLPAEVTAAFDAMTVADLAVDPMTLNDMPFVRSLPSEINTQNRIAQRAGRP